MGRGADDAGPIGPIGPLASAAAEELALVHAARELALRACRAAIQASGRSVRATHRHERDPATALAGRAQAELEAARAALRDHPTLAGAGLLYDAEKEYAEAALLVALATDGVPPGHAALGVPAAAWLNGLAEAASELRRDILDLLRAGELARAEALFGAMEGVYGALVTVDFPDAVTGGLRRATDALRAVLERTRSDLTTTVLHARLQARIEQSLAAREVT
jgi:translin